MTGEVFSGWGFPGAARKAHFFDNSAISLCGRWMFAGRLDPDTEKASPDDCVTCRRELDKRKAVAA